MFSESTEKEVPIFQDESSRDHFDEYSAKLRAAKRELEKFKRTKRYETYGRTYDSIAAYLLAAQRNTPSPVNESGMRQDRLHDGVLARIRNTLADTRNYHHELFWVWHEVSDLSGDAFRAKMNSIIQRAKLFLKIARDDEEPEESEMIEDIYDKPINFRLAEALIDSPPRSLDELAAIYGNLCQTIAMRWLSMIEEANKKDIDPPQRLEDDADNAIMEMMFSTDPILDLSDEDLKNSLEGEPRETIDQMEQAALQIRLDPKAPPHARILVDGNPDREQYVFIRGKQDRTGDRVEPRFLRILDPNSDVWSMKNARKELADSLSDPLNPLTARVWVNRVWGYLFGQGLVKTTSDFGIRGDVPSHPELLDALALEFMRRGWSTKQLIRRIVLSEAYLQSSRDRDPGLESDPENRLVWRMNRKRMTREAVRDNLMAAAERLDLSPVGQSLSPDELTDHPNRTVYFSVHRRQLDPFARDFDMANPMVHSPARHETTVPQQALFMLNHPLVFESAREIADNIWDEEDRYPSIVGLYKKILRREPTDQEVALCESFLDEVQQSPSVGVLSRSTAWRYGVAEYSTKSKGIKDFVEFENQVDGRWQVGESFPDEKAGHVHLHSEGGHPGHDSKQVVVLKWVAPEDASLSIQGSIQHFHEDESPQIDGVALAVVLNDDKVLKKETARFAAKEFEIQDILVKAGDTVQFAVHGRKNHDNDEFGWHFQIKATNAEDTEQVTEYDSVSDFRTEPLFVSDPLDGPSQLAQVLLMSNEFLYID